GRGTRAPARARPGGEERERGSDDPGGEIDMRAGSRQKAGPRGRADALAPSRAQREERRDVGDRHENDHVPAPPREDEMPAQTRENRRDERGAAGGKERRSEERAGRERQQAAQRRQHPNTEDRRSEEPDHRAETLEIQDAHGAARSPGVV